MVEETKALPSAVAPFCETVGAAHQRSPTSSFAVYMCISSLQPTQLTQALTSLVHQTYPHWRLVAHANGMSAGEAEKARALIASRLPAGKFTFTHDRGHDAPGELCLLYTSPSPRD